MATLTIGGKTVVTQTGTDEPIIGSDVVFPAGHVLQTKFVYFDDIQTIGNGSTTGKTFTTIGSGFTGKEFLIDMAVTQGNIVYGQGFVNMSANNRYTALKVYAGSTQIAKGLDSGQRTGVTSSNWTNYDNTSYDTLMYPVPFSFTYNPQTTNNIQYSIKAASTWTDTTVTYINRIPLTNDNPWSHRGYSHFILMEIAQ